MNSETQLSLSSRKAVTAAGIVAVLALLLGGLWMRVSRDQDQALLVLRMKKLKMLYVASGAYGHARGGCPPAHTINDDGEPMQSWRVLILPYLELQSLYSQIDQSEAWDSPANEMLLTPMPEIYRSPSTESKGSTTDYFAVLGPHAPWWNTEGLKPWESASANEIMFIEITGLDVPWMKPWDPTVDQVLDILLPQNANSASSRKPKDIMCITVGGDIRTVDAKCDRESLRKLLLGLEK